MSYVTSIGAAFTVVALLGSAAAGCRGSHEAAKESAPGKSAFGVAIVLPGAHDDHEWSQAAYEGLEMIQREFGARVAYADKVPGDDFARVAGRFAKDGYTFVIGHGAEYAHGAEQVAEQYPRTKFGLVALHPGNNKNLGAIRFREGELGYLTGMVAGLRTKSKKVIYVAGMKFAHLEEQAALFARGAKAVDPSIEVAIEWIGRFGDAEKLRTVCHDYTARGFDVLSVNDWSFAVAVDEAKKAHAWAIGWNLDQNELGPETVVTSGVQRIPVLLLEAARLVRKGYWEGKQYKFGLREGAQDLAPFRGLLTADGAARVASTRDGILAGNVDVSWNPPLVAP